MSNPKHDVVVIGGGPGGYAAALYGAAAGLDVAVVECGKLGGTCLHVGCIPAKELLEAASVYRTVRRAGEFGVLAGEPGIDWTAVLGRKLKVIEQLATGLASLLGQRKVTVYPGTGSIQAAGTVAVKPAAMSEGSDSTDSTDGTNSTDAVQMTDPVQMVEAPSIIVASGSTPRTLPGFEVDGRIVVTSDQLFTMVELPATAVVIGGGAIGCEFASMMGDLGVDVTVLEALPDILTGCDTDVAKVVRRSFRKRQIKVHTGVTVEGHEPRADGSGTVVSYGDDRRADVDLVVIAVGRRPRTEGLGLTQAGVQMTDRGFIVADGTCRTSVPGIWAVGDVLDTPQLAHTAFAEGMLAISDILGEQPEPLNYQATPWCIYCHPEVAFVGYAEAAARAAGHDVVTSTHRHMGNGRAQILGETDGLVKVIAERLADGTGGRILGVHMAGPWVTEQLGQGYLAVNWEATVTEVARFIQPHPTMSELFGEAALSLTGRSLHG